MKTIGDLVKKVKEEGQDEVTILVSEVTDRYGAMASELSELEKLPQDMGIQKYIEENSSWIYFEREINSLELKFDGLDFFPEEK